MITLLDHELGEASQRQGDTRDEQAPESLSSPPPGRCCLLLPHSCRQRQEHPSLKSSPRSRFVLTGPSQSGKSSLLFQLACAEAARDTRVSVVYIRVQDDDANSDSSRHDDANWLPLEGCCLGELESKSPCSILHQKVAPANDWSSQLSLAKSHGSFPLTASYFNEPSVLSRIQMHHVVSIRDVYHLLLSEKAFVGHYRTSLIVLDDLDQLFPQHDHNKQDLHMAVSQLLSVLVETANSAGTPISLAVSMTAMTTSGSMRSHAAPMLFSPTLNFDTIQISGPPNDGIYKQRMSQAAAMLHQHSPDMVITSNWCLKSCKDGGDENTYRCQYAIVKDGMDPDNASKRVLMHL